MRKKLAVGKNTHWDEKKKMEVVQAYIILGQVRAAAATCNVPEDTVRHWRMTAWWKESEAELRLGSKLKLSNRISELVGKALEHLADRIDQGDFIANKVWDEEKKTFKIEWVRKPLSADSLNKISTQLIDRSLAVERAAVPERITDEGLEARLAKLRDEMLGFSKSKSQPKEITNVVLLESENNVYGVLPEEGSPSTSDDGSDIRPADDSSSGDVDGQDPGPGGDHAD